jgi:16S rRNA (guanine1207-N2)-methyltransferase
MIGVEVKGVALRLETAPGLFSPQRADRGTLAMLSVVDFAPGMKVLDLGCGCGLVGLLAAKLCGEWNVVMCDVDPLAVDIARKNAERNGVGGVKIALSDGFGALDDTGFDLILSNPPYQSDFAVARGFIEKGFNRLKIGGRMVMVTRRREWYRNKLIAIFGGVKIQEVDGYFVFEAQRRGERYANRRGFIK